MGRNYHGLTEYKYKKEEVQIMKSTKNIGESGPNSIRIGGMKICDLPIAESAAAKQQLPLALDTERQNKIDDVIAGAPKQRVTYLESRIIECQANVVRISEMKSQQQATISEYVSQISLCKFRDGEISKLGEDDSDYDKKAKDLYKQFPPYDVKAMEQQIEQSEESIIRADEVIAKEYTSIAELRELLVLCQQRDTLLRSLGASIAVG